MKTDRLIGILTVLLQNEKITAPELARRFEVSRRTILRDIDALCLAGIPIVSLRGAGGGIRIMEGYKLDKAVLSTRELQELAAALRGVACVSEDSVGLLHKLVPENALVSLADSIIIDLSSHYQEALSEKIALFKQAIAARRTVRFDYFSSNGESTRELEPYFVEFRWAAWYVFGWCRLRQGFRRFKLNRLWHPAMTDEAFTPRPVPPEQKSGEASFPENGHMKIRFEKSVRFRLIEAYGLHCYAEDENGLLLDLDYSNREYMLSWILGFGDKAELLEPPELREDLAQTARRMAARYDSQS